MANGLPFLNLEEILEKVHRGKKLSQRELGYVLSRTFGPNIDLLTFARGKYESKDKTDFVINLNNNARFADVVEDGKLKKAAKLDAHLRLEHIYNRIDRADVDVEELIKIDLEDLVKDVLKGALNENEIIFIKQFGYGDALRDLRGFKPGIKNAIVPAMNKMVNGMGIYLKKGKLETIAELRDYCYFVAGTVGDALNSIVRVEDGENLNYNNARSIATYFQLNNIDKNVREDFELREYRVKFIPDELHDGVNHEDLFNKTTKDIKKVRESVMERLLSFTEEYFQPSIQYVIDIPRKLSGHLAFCGVPLAISKENQKLMRKAGAEKVFSGDKDAIKVERKLVENVISFVYRAVQADDGIKFITFLNDYRKDPNQFSFESGTEKDKYEQWSPAYLT